MSVTNVKSRWHEGNLIFEAADGTELARFDGTSELLIVPDAVKNKRTRVTAAQINAGHTLLPAIPGFKYRIHDFTFIAIGGNAATATAVDLKGTSGGSAETIASIAVAALTRSTAVKPNTANVTLLADGASHDPLDANTAVTVIKSGSDLATATHIDVILSYTIEAA